MYEVPAQGYNCDIQYLDDAVRKVTLDTFAAPAVETLAAELETYASELQEGPLPTVQLRHVEMLPQAEGRFKLAHEVTRCHGPNHSELQDEALHLATTRLLGGIGAMATINQDPNVLYTPIDAKAFNFHLNKGEPTLVDIFPPLTRRPDGAFPAGNIPFGELPVRRQVMERILGTKTGAMSWLLASSLYSPAGPRDAVTGNLALGRAESDWCYDALPANLAPAVKDGLRRDIASRFLGPNMSRWAAVVARKAGEAGWGLPFRRG